MENQRVLNLLNEASSSKLVVNKWKIVNHQSNPNYDVANDAKVLKSNLSGYYAA